MKSAPTAPAASIGLRAAPNPRPRPRPRPPGAPAPLPRPPVPAGCDARPNPRDSWPAWTGAIRYGLGPAGGAP